MSGYTRWSDICAEVVERAGKQELRAEICRARGLTRQQPAPSYANPGKTAPQR